MQELVCSTYIYFRQSLKVIISFSLNSLVCSVHVGHSWFRFTNTNVNLGGTKLKHKKPSISDKLKIYWSWNK